MFPNNFLIECAKFVNLVVPVNTTGAAQPASASLGWVGFNGARKMAFVIQGGAWAGGTPAVTLKQAVDINGTSAKALAFSRYFTYGPTPADLPAEVAVVSNTFNLAAAANQMAVIEVHAQDLDLNNSFSYVQLNIASPGSNADLISALAIVYDLPHNGKPALLPSVLV